MRQILFRIKDEKSGKWHFGLPIHFDKSREFCSFEQDLRMGYWYDVSICTKTLGQYIGLKDKNGRKIFEGDIVKYTRKHMYCPTANFHNKDLVSLHKIYWNEEHYQFWEEHYPLDDREFRCIGGGPIGFDDERADENIIEVVGNIYDNPELLNGERL